MKNNWIRTIKVQFEWRNPTVWVSRLIGEPRYYGDHYGITDASMARIQRLFNQVDAIIDVDIENQSVSLSNGM